MTINNTKDFIKKIKRNIKEQDIENIVALFNDSKNYNAYIEISKKEELFFTQRNNCDIVDAIISNLLNMDFSYSETKQFFHEQKVINDVMKETWQLQAEIKIPKHRLLAAVLKSSKFHYEAARERKYDDLDRVKEIESQATVINNIIKSLCYNSKVYNSENECFIYTYRESEVKDRDMRRMFEYFNKAMLTYSWSIVIANWKMGCINIIQNGFKLFVKISNVKKIKSIYDMYKKEAVYEGKRIAYYALKHLGKTNMKKEDRLDSLFAISKKKMDHFFFVEDSSDIVINEVEIKYWLKTYEVLCRYAHKHCSFTFDMFPFSILHFLKAKWKDRWIKILCNNNIPFDKAKIMFDKLIFTKKATDTYDYPFIKLKNGKYIINDAIINGAEPTAALISRFCREDFNVSIKGKNFENYIKNKLHGFGIDAIRVYHKVGGNEYEVDLAFVLDGDIVFCECKNKRAINFHYYDDSYIAEDVVQAKRVTEFYRRNPNLIYDQFKTLGLKKQFKINSFILYSQAYYGLPEVEGINILDYEDFLLPFCRNDEAYEFICKLPKLKHIFIGNYTLNKLMSYYKCGYNIDGYRNIVERDTVSYSIGKYVLDIEMLAHKPMPHLQAKWILIKEQAEKSGMKIKIEEIGRIAEREKEWLEDASEFFRHM